MITATPTINKSIDLYGTLSPIWKCLPACLVDQLDYEIDSAPELEVRDYLVASDEAKAAMLTSVNLVDLPSA